MSTLKIELKTQFKKINWYVPIRLFNKVKELIETKDFEAAKTFVAENQEQLGEYFSQAQQLISGSEGPDGLVSKIKGFF